MSNSKEISEAVKNAIRESGYKKAWIADQIGISRQTLYKRLDGDMSIGSIIQILDIIGYKLAFKIFQEE